MNKTYTLVVEHTAAGIVEHATPVVAEWVSRGHRALIMASDTANQAVRREYANISVRFGLIGADPIQWEEVHALFNVLPGEPGALFRDPNGRWDIPRVTINHGLTDKQTTFPADYIGNGVGYANVLLACGTAMFRGSWERYIRRWPEILHSLLVIHVGSPKTDVLFAGVFQRNRVLQSMGLDPARKTVLYAPTYQREASLEQAGRAILEALVAMPVNVIARLHHLSVRDEWTQWLGKLEARHANFRFSQGSSNPLFVAADLMVGDASGASFEYILQDKPVVFFDVPGFFKAHGCDGVGFWGREAGVVVSSTPDMCSAVAAELSNPMRGTASRHALIGQLVCARGGASARATDTILDLIEGRRNYPAWGPRQCLREETLLREYILERLERCACETKQVALFGAGNHTKKLLTEMRALKKRGRRMPEISCILDDHVDALKTDFDGIALFKPDHPKLPMFDAVILSSDYHQNVFRKRCEAVFGSTMPLVDLYAPFPWHAPARPAAQ